MEVMRQIENACNLQQLLASCDIYEDTTYRVVFDFAMEVSSKMSGNSEILHRLRKILDHVLSTARHAHRNPMFASLTADDFNGYLRAERMMFIKGAANPLVLFHDEEALERALANRDKDEAFRRFARSALLASGLDYDPALPEKRMDRQAFTRLEAMSVRDAQQQAEYQSAINNLWASLSSPFYVREPDRTRDPALIKAQEQAHERFVSSHQRHYERSKRHGRNPKQSQLGSINGSYTGTDGHPKSRKGRGRGAANRQSDANAAMAQELARQAAATRAERDALEERKKEAAEKAKEERLAAQKAQKAKEQEEDRASLALERFWYVTRDLDLRSEPLLNGATVSLGKVVVADEAVDFDDSDQPWLSFILKFFLISATQLWRWLWSYLGISHRRYDCSACVHRCRFDHVKLGPEREWRAFHQRNVDLCQRAILGRCIYERNVYDEIGLPTGWQIMAEVPMELSSWASNFDRTSGVVDGVVENTIHNVARDVYVNRPYHSMPTSLDVLLASVIRIRHAERLNGGVLNCRSPDEWRRFGDTFSPIVRSRSGRLCVSLTFVLILVSSFAVTTAVLWGLSILVLLDARMDYLLWCLAFQTLETYWASWAVCAIGLVLICHVAHWTAKLNRLALDLWRRFLYWLRQTYPGLRIGSILCRTAFLAVVLLQGTLIVYLHLLLQADLQASSNGKTTAPIKLTE